MGNVRVRLGWLAASALALLPSGYGCGASGTVFGGDAACPDCGGPEAGIVSLLDGATASDAGVPRDGREGADADPTAFANACLDGIDQDGVNGVDCEDLSCEAAPSCCVGSSDARCCAGSIVPVQLDFRSCTDTDCPSLAGLSVFGSPGPILTGGGLAPVADTAADSGFLSAVEVDPRAAIVTLRASLALPAAPIGAAAIDAIGFGLAGSMEVRARMLPVVALVASRSRGDVTLQVAGEVVGTLGATSVDYQSFTLTLSPSGVVLAEGPTGSFTAQLTLPPHALHPLVYGRATNPGSAAAALPARIATFDATVNDCDQPTALSRDAGPLRIVDETGSAMLAGATAPSVATRGGEVLLAFAAPSMGGDALAVYVARRAADGSFHVENGSTQPVLRPPPGARLTDPVLRDDGDAWTLFATERVGEHAQIVTSTGGAGHGLTFGASRPLTIESAALGDLDSPTLVPSPSGETDPTRLIARSTTAAGTQLVLLELSPTDLTGAYTPSTAICGAEDTCADGVRSAARIRAAQVGTLAFDADEIASPSLVLVNHVYRLFYAGRRGARWSIGMLYAADLEFWRAANGAQPVFDADGEGFDAVSVLEPAAVLEDGHLALYYVGFNGLEHAIGVSRGSTFGVGAP